MLQHKVNKQLQVQINKVKAHHKVILIQLIMNITIILAKMSIIVTQIIMNIIAILEIIAAVVTKQADILYHTAAMYYLHQVIYKGYQNNNLDMLEMKYTQDTAESSNHKI